MPLRLGLSGFTRDEHLMDEAAQGRHLFGAAFDTASDMYVCLSQCRAFLAAFISLIVASRSLSRRSASFDLSIDMATIIGECCWACWR